MKNEILEAVRTIYSYLDKKPLTLHYTQMSVRADFGRYALNFSLGDEPWYDTTKSLSKEEIAEIEHYLSFNYLICDEIKYLDKLLDQVPNMERVYTKDDLDFFSCF